MYNNIIRKIKFQNQSKKQACYICNKYNSIAELHHLLEVSDIEKVIKIINEDELKELFKGVWLCPNHHAIYHKLQNPKTVDILMELNCEETKKFQELYGYTLDLYNQLTKYIRNSNEDKILKLEAERHIQNKKISIRTAEKMLNLIK